MAASAITSRRDGHHCRITVARVACRLHRSRGSLKAIGFWPDDSLLRIRSNIRFTARWQSRSVARARRFQLAGHLPVAVAGGATGCIGDPSGKTDERQLLSRAKCSITTSRVSSSSSGRCSTLKRKRTRRGWWTMQVGPTRSRSLIFCATSASTSR